MGVSFRTIDNVVPKGLCGSGIVDVIAEMLKVGIIDKMGLIEPEACSPRLRINKDGESEFVVVQGRDSSGDVVVTQKDIGAIQLAKAAVYTAISILMQEMKVEPQQINRVYIAGAFGTYVNPANARTIGMIPAFPLNIVTSVGNTATAGARMALVSSKHRMMCEKISKRVEYIELATHPSFHPVFMESLCFPPTAN